MSADEFATVVRGLPLTPAQAAAADEVLASRAAKELPAELIRRGVLTPYQAKLILAGRAAELTVGRYVILEEVGVGGVGPVYAARDPAADRVVALKLIRPDRLAGPAAYGRFQQETRAAARLAHPNIVRAYDAGSADGKHFLATEFVDGRDLAEELHRRGAMPAGEACEYARQAAAGLQHAFEKGLIHGAIKPNNLLLSTAEGLVKVADFGLARLTEPTTTGPRAADGAVTGTPDYLAPEQARPAAAADTRSDIYSLGCTLYHLLTGRVPFPADAAAEKTFAHASHQPQSLADSCPDLNPALVAVVGKMMAKDPADRYQTPAEAAAALAPFCRRTLTSISEPSKAPGRQSVDRRAPVRPPSTAGGLSRPAASLPRSEEPPGTAHGTEPPPRLRPAALLVVLAIAAVFGAVFGPRLGRRSDHEAEPVANAPVPFIPGPSERPAAPPAPVSVTVNVGDWAKAREPGVSVSLVGDSAPAAVREKVRTAADLAKPLALPPGRYTLVLKKDGKEVEARSFEVTTYSAGMVVAATPASLPPVAEPAGDPPRHRR